MAGIYIHIPFCKSRCIYCDFYSTTKLELQHSYVKALLCELETRKLSALNAFDSVLRTVYIGGGTPSVLDICSIDKLSGQISDLYGLEHLQEFTVEVNPDCISSEYAGALAQLPVTRVSMGVQSFNDEILKFMNRRHDSAGAIQAYRNLRHTGFDNISLDLMFGIPGQTIDMLLDDLDKMLELAPEHISIYSLSYEPGTCLERMVSAGQVSSLSDETCMSMYSAVCRKLTEAGYFHYEISNFARKGRESVHNSNYWNGTPYLGIGAGAHSYNGTDTRCFNNPDLNRYIAYYLKDKEDGTDIVDRFERIASTAPCEFEHLDSIDLRNEYIMLALRTIRGINLDDFKKKFGNESLEQLLFMARPQIKNENLAISNSTLFIPENKFYISNSIIVDLFLEKD